MKNLLRKEMKFASPLSYWFIAFALMVLLPNYPVLVSAFFVSFGIFQTFQANREANDTLYAAMLPVAKASVVKAKFLFAVLIPVLWRVKQQLPLCAPDRVGGRSPVLRCRYLMVFTPCCTPV